MDSVFADNYEERVKTTQGELYEEIERILNLEIDSFILKTGFKPSLLDIGGAGLFLYDTDKLSRVTILDLFLRPDNIKMSPNSEWIKGNILDEKLVLGKYDIVIMSSLLHHLCNARNGINNNLRTCLRNVKKLLNESGRAYIFEGTCPVFFTILQDILYPVYSRILTGILKFTYVRMTSFNEIYQALKINGFSIYEIDFKQPKYVALIFKKIPTKFTPLTVHAIVAYLK